MVYVKTLVLSQVSKRTSNDSHVTEYGAKEMHNEAVSLYQGHNPAPKTSQLSELNSPMAATYQREADILSMWALVRAESNFTFPIQIARF